MKEALSAADEARAARLRSALDEQFGLSARGVSDLQLLDAASVSGWTPESDRGALSQVVDLLPISESALFRNPTLWTFLSDRVLPPLLTRALQGGRMVRVVSLGCSQGQEVFSLAMKLLEVAVSLGALRSTGAKLCSVLGIDAAPARIELARSGMLSSWSIDRGRREWALPHVAERGNGYEVSAEVRALCRFEVGNLLEVTSAAAPQLVDLQRVDLVLCQHVLVYFDEAKARQVVSRLASMMTPGAMLIVAAPEAHLLDHERLAAAGHVGSATVVRPAERTAATKVAPLNVQTRPERSRPFVPAVRADGSERERLLAATLSLAAAGKFDLALQEAERLWKLSPENLVSRFVLGQALLDKTPSRARLLLQDVLRLGEKLPQSEVVPGADELSVGQMVDAANLLLGSRSRR